MTARSGRKLSEEDRIVWGTVARTVRPLRPRPEFSLGPPTELPLPKPAEPARKPALPPYIPDMSPKGAKGPGPNLNRAEVEKLAKGRTPIEARLDLHGMVQSEAHSLLLRFLRSAQMQGIRSVLIITGKGTARGSDGVLRRMVPQWLATAPFSDMVASHAEAGRRHGGSGALYVKLKQAGRAHRQ